MSKFRDYLRAAACQRRAHPTKDTMVFMAIGTRTDQIVVDAEPEDVGMSSARLGNVSRLVQRYIDDRKLPGALSLVARRGQVVHLQTYGNMDDARQKPVK